MINPSIFRSYDIRGSSLIDISTDIAYKIGYCFSQLNISKNNNKICVGMDGRLSSPSLYKALSQGINDGGGKVISIGVVPTPMLYFADHYFSPAASIMITGSHNPKNDNGFKMTSMGMPFFGKQIQNLLSIIQKTNWQNIKAVSVDVELKDIKEQYINRILADLNFSAALRVAWDPGNGSGGEVIDMMVNKLPNYNLVINSQIDGNFPSHHPDPTVPANLSQLIEVVRSEKCDIGIAFDGDADRIGIVTIKGEIIWGDQIICLFAKDILRNNPGATIIADVKASQVVFDYVKSCGGNPLMWKTGHSLIKTKMVETNALLAGEMSGHIFFADKYYGYDDAIYAAARFLDLLSRSSTPLEKMVSILPKVYNTPEIRIRTTDELKFQIIDKIKEHLREMKVNFNDIDGLRVTTAQGWWLLRASNTEQSIIARCEANTSENLKVILSELTELLKNYELSLS